MLCQACGFENPAGSVYCQQCGSRLHHPELTGSGDGGAPVALGNSASPVASMGGQTTVEPSNGSVSSGPFAPSAQPTDTSGANLCPRCRAVNESLVRFCVECGFSFPNAPSGAPEAELRGGEARGAPPEGSPKRGTEASGDQGSNVARGAPAQIVAILKDGSDGRVYPLYNEVTDIGRTEGDVVLSDDPYLSPRHARLLRRGGRWVLRDLDSVNGIYLRIRKAAGLVDGDMLLIGQQVVRFEVLGEGELPLGPAKIHGVLAFGTPEVPRRARLVQYTTEGVGRDVHYLYRDETVIGRESGDIVFTDDPFLSRRHAAVTVDAAHHRFSLQDLGSSNGTAIRFRGEHVLVDADQFRIGRHLFRFEQRTQES